MDGWNISFLLGRLGLFSRGKLAVSFREGKTTEELAPSNGVERHSPLDQFLMITKTQKDLPCRNHFQLNRKTSRSAEIKFGIEMASLKKRVGSTRESLQFQRDTLPETNVAPENGWLEY